MKKIYQWMFNYSSKKLKVRSLQEFYDETKKLAAKNNENFFHIGIEWYAPKSLNPGLKYRCYINPSRLTQWHTTPEEALKEMEEKLFPKPEQEPVTTDVFI